MNTTNGYEQSSNFASPLPLHSLPSPLTERGLRGEVVRVCFLFALALSMFGPTMLFNGCSSNSKKEVATHQQKTMYHCPMHPNYISDKPGNCPICGMNIVAFNSGDSQTAVDSSKKTDMDKNTVKIDPVTVQNMGVTTETVHMRTLTKEVRAGATVALDETKVSTISIKVMGWIDKLYVNYTGEKVTKGQPLFDLYSPDLVSTQEEYLQALRYARQQAGNDSSGADRLVQSSRRRLANWDISGEQLARLETSGKAERTLAIHAPGSGIVLEKNITVGQNVMPGLVLYKIADLSKVWVVANIYQNDIPFVNTGMTAEVELQAQPGTIYKGTVSFISPTLDPVAKTAQVRIEVNNTPGLVLKPEMFATVVIKSPVVKEALAVPEQAVIHTGTRNIVIIDMGKGYYKPMEVRLGLSAQGYVQVLDGLTEGDVIVTSSQFMIDAESNLRKAIGQMSGNEHSVM